VGFKVLKLRLFRDRLTMLRGPSRDGRGSPRSINYREGELAMKRLLVLVALLVSLSSSVTGCGEGGTGKPVVQPSKEQIKNDINLQKEMMKKMQGGGTAK
jgi:hypothetical protein